jgi:hypothetical protein
MIYIGGDKKMRTDVHAPKNFDPADYEWVGLFYQGGDIAMLLYSRSPWMQKIRETLRSNPFHGNHYEKGTCDHCGAWFDYGEVYKHTPTGQYVCVGHICAAKAFGCSDKQTFQYRQLKKQIAGIRQSMAQKKRADTFIVEHNLADDLEGDHYIIQDIRRKLTRYGSLSNAQIALVRKIAKEIREKAACREEERQNASPVVEGNGIEIEGLVVNTKYHRNGYGESLKMVVKDDRGFCVWGTVPEILLGNESVKGRRVKFVANVQKSYRDDCFGFFKRPRRAEFIGTKVEVKS